MGEATSSALVTGASGFLGRVLCQRLKTMGNRVIGAGRHASEGPWDEFREMDLAADSLPAGLLDTVYHLASKAHAVTETAAEADTYRPIIVEGTRKLLELAVGSGVQRFIYVSSVKAMGEGNPAGLPVEQMDETWPHTPQTPYGIAKAEAENLVGLRTRREGEFAENGTGSEAWTLSASSRDRKQALHDPCGGSCYVYDPSQTEAGCQRKVLHSVRNGCAFHPGIVRFHPGSVGDAFSRLEYSVYCPENLCRDWISTRVHNSPAHATGFGDPVQVDRVGLVLSGIGDQRIGLLPATLRAGLVGQSGLIGS
jgi:hypothetical protein